MVLALAIIVMNLPLVPHVMRIIVENALGLNQAVGGAKDSNHLMGCAADLRCIGLEQALRYATILLDKFDEAHADFDEIAVERNLNIYWLHFAVRPKGNRRKVFLQVKR